MRQERKRDSVAVAVAVALHPPLLTPRAIVSEAASWDPPKRKSFEHVISQLLLKTVTSKTLHFTDGICHFESLAVMNKAGTY